MPNIRDFGGTTMYVGKLVFSQVIDHLALQTFRRCVARYDGNRYKKSILRQYVRIRSSIRRNVIPRVAIRCSGVATALPLLPNITDFFLVI